MKSSRSCRTGVSWFPSWCKIFRLKIYFFSQFSEDKGLLNILLWNTVFQTKCDKFTSPQKLVYSFPNILKIKLWNEFVNKTSFRNQEFIRTQGSYHKNFRKILRPFRSDWSSLWPTTKSKCNWLLDISKSFLGNSGKTNDPANTSVRLCSCTKPSVCMSSCTGTINPLLKQPAFRKSSCCPPLIPTSLEQFRPEIIVT